MKFKLWFVWAVGSAIGGLIIFSILSYDFEGISWFSWVPFLVLWYEIDRWMYRRANKLPKMPPADEFDRELQELLKRERGN